MTRTRLLRILREVLLTSTAVLGAACLVVVAVGLAFNIRPLMFRSGSMSPTIDTGDLSLSRTVDASALHRGDIVSVVAANGERVTHRVVSVTGAGGTRELTLKGDANDVVDTQVYDVQSAQRVLFTVPKAGYVVNWFSHAPGAYLLALYLGLMLMLIFRRPQDEDQDPAGGTPEPEVVTTSAEDPKVDAAKPGRRRPLRAAVIGSGLIAGLVALSAWTLPTWAYWADTSAVTGTTFTTAAAFRPAAPVVTCGTLGKKLVRVNWTAVPGATSYDMFFPTSGSTAVNITATTFDLTTVNQSGTFQIKAKNAAGSSSFSNSLTYDVGNGSSNGTCS